jgi:hypothetical protein
MNLQMVNQEISIHFGKNGVGNIAIKKVEIDMIVREVARGLFNLDRKMEPIGLAINEETSIALPRYTSLFPPSMEDK